MVTKHRGSYSNEASTKHYDNCLIYENLYLHIMIPLVYEDFAFGLGFFGSMACVLCGYVVVDSLFFVAAVVCEGSVLVLVLLCRTKSPF